MFQKNYSKSEVYVLEFFLGKTHPKINFMYSKTCVLKILFWKFNH